MTTPDLCRWCRHAQSVHADDDGLGQGQGRCLFCERHPLMGVGWCPAFLSQHAWDEAEREQDSVLTGPAAFFYVHGVKHAIAVKYGGGKVVPLRLTSPIYDALRHERDTEATAQGLADADAEAEDWASGPHSRACGIRPHDHGNWCSTNCPTCGGRARD